MTEEQEMRYDRYHDFYKAHGYEIVADPILGVEDTFLDDLGNGVREVEKRLAFIRKAFGYRGLSKNVLAELHRYRTPPSANVGSN